MTAECIVQFKDIEAGKVREVGERFEVTPERLSAINSTKYGQLVREVRQRTKKPKEQEQ